MINQLRQIFLVLTKQSESASASSDARRLAILAIKAGGLLPKHVHAIAQTAEQHAARTGTWVSAEALSAGGGGPFDACDLRHWLALAARCAVPTIPAREILRLTEEEMSIASGETSLPKILAKRLRLAAGEHFDMTMLDADGKHRTLSIDREALTDALAAAMDGVPEGWMVRHTRAGPSSLKTLAGVGIAGTTAPGTRFGPDLEIGPGWIRRGNRRSVDVSDKRFVMAAAEGPSEASSVFVARPWVEASRWSVGDDPHRHGTQFAGKGTWPAEWRAFVEKDEVIGVSSYYAWCGSPTPENARVALEVRALAQRLVDEAKAQRAIPEYMGVELLRGSPQFPEIDERFPEGHVACTLDFIETKHGILFLEGGPAFAPFGGGHPCGFAGIARPDGVAFRIMPDVILADSKTWHETDRTGCILDWSAVEALATFRPAARP